MKRNGKKDDYIYLTKVHLNLLKELNYLNDWLKSRNPKKMTSKVQDLMEEFKLIKKADQPLKSKMEHHLKDKTAIIKDAIDRKLDDIIVFDNFIKIVKSDFKGNDVVGKHIEETVKLHDVYNNDLRKAKELIDKL